MKIKGKLAIFAGRGQLPQILIKNCQKNNIDFQVFLLASEKYDHDYTKFNPISLKYGEIGRFLQELQQKNIKNIIFIGAVNKPNFSNLKVDAKGTVLVAKILANKILGDDAVLSTVIKYFQKQGFKILQINDLLDDIVSKKGALTTAKPDKSDLKNIEIAKKAIQHFAKFDVGQAVLVAQKQIIAVEALEGTDNMIKRASTLKTDYQNNAILVKMKKPNQSAKADLPTIGLKTIENCAKNNIKGIAIEAKKTLIIDKEKVIAKANENNIFLIAI